MYISSEIRLSKNKEFLNDIEYWVERPCKSAGAFLLCLKKKTLCDIIWENCYPFPKSYYGVIWKYYKCPYYSLYDYTQKRITVLIRRLSVSYSAYQRSGTLSDVWSLSCGSAIGSLDRSFSFVSACCVYYPKIVERIPPTIYAVVLIPSIT